MRIWLAASVAAILVAATVTTAAQAADDPLRICLDENLPPLSVHKRGKPDSGFDVALAKAVADRLGRPLKIQWFESELDDSSSPALEANALLSDGRCSLVGSFAFTKSALVKPAVETALLPDFEGAGKEDRRRRVKLGEIAPSQPYIFSSLTVVLGPKAQNRKITGIGDLAGLRIAVVGGTLADAILMTFDKGRLIDNISHLIAGRDDVISGLERGDFDATLLDLRRFDAYRVAHPDTKVTASGYFHPIGSNFGYVGLAGDPNLAAVNKALSDLQAAGTIAQLAQAEGLTYLAPREPIILGDMWEQVFPKK